MRWPQMVEMQSLCPLALGEGQQGRMGVECELHPFIHTWLGFIQAQDVEKKKAEPKLRSLLPLSCRVPSKVEQ